ncbi:MAG TPA: hypothetical protein VF995_01055 [Actinomycetota bacterium]
MAAILLMIGLVVLGVFGGLFGTDTRDSSDWSRSTTDLHSHNR